MPDTTKKYLDLTGLTAYDTKIKAKISADDADTLDAAKDYADGLASDYDAAGSAATSLATAKSYADGLASNYDASGSAATALSSAKTYTDTEVAGVQSDVDTLETFVGTLPTSGTSATTVIGYIDEKTTGIASSSAITSLDTRVTTAEGEIDTLQTSMTAAESDIDTLESEMDTAQADIDAVEATVTTLVGSDSNKSVRTIANEELAARLIPTNASESLDTLQEIAAWIQAHPNDASAMNGAIEDLEELVGEIPSGATATDIVGYIAEVIGAEKTRAEGVEDGLDGRMDTAESDIDALQTDTHTHSNKSVLDGITSTKVTAWDGAVTDQHTHSNKSVLDGITSTKVTAWDSAESNAKSYADGLVADFVAVTTAEINALFTSA